MVRLRSVLTITWNRGCGYRPTGCAAYSPAREIALLVTVALLARATVSGVEPDVVGASQLAGRKLLTGVLGLLGVLAHIAVLVLPLALAIHLVIRHQPRRLAEAVGTGAVFDRDQQAAGALYRLYRRLRLKAQVSRSGMLPVERAVGRCALLAELAIAAGPAARGRRGDLSGPVAAQVPRLLKNAGY